MVSTSSAKIPPLEDPSHDLSPPARKYPPELIEEYQRLAQKKLLQNSSQEEEAHLAKIMQHLDSLDESSPDEQVWRAQCAKIRAELEQIQREVEDLANGK